MRRRDAMTALLAGALPLRAQVDDSHTAALLVDVQTRKLIAAHAPELAASALLPPGSTIKPFALAALMEAGKLRPEDTFHCPGELMVGDRRVVCAHQPLG